jgi:hypothetical protein
MLDLSLKLKKQPKTSPEQNRRLPIDLPAIYNKNQPQKANKSQELNNTHKQNDFYAVVSSVFSMLPDR